MRPTQRKAKAVDEARNEVLRMFFVLKLVMPEEKPTLPFTFTSQ
jgi:hypothetical protein